VLEGRLGRSRHPWRHTTFLVDSLPGERALLNSAGFLQSSEPTCALTDSENGWKIRLLEEMPKWTGFVGPMGTPGDYGRTQELTNRLVEPACRKQLSGVSDYESDSITVGVHFLIFLFKLNQCAQPVEWEPCDAGQEGISEARYSN
jgi:hypothetical protein